MRCVLAIKVLFVCHGNICRSTMAESVFTHMVRQLGIEDDFEINSAATSREEIGNPVHYGTVNKLRQVGVEVVAHKAVQVTEGDLSHYDYILVMDENNLRNMNRMFGNSDKVSKLLSFAGSCEDIADPWYTGNFDQTYDDICAGLEGFLAQLKY